MAIPANPAMAPTGAHSAVRPAGKRRPPRDREEVPVQISRLLEAHELIIRQARELADQADDAGDWGTNDLMASEVLPHNELQAWFVSEHVVDTPVVRA